MHDFDLAPYTFVKKATAEQIAPERELELIQAYRLKGDRDALSQLLEGARWQPAIIARDFGRTYRVMGHFYDMFVEGQMGMINAANKYDLASGTRFTSYSFKYCQGPIQEYVRNAAGSVVKGRGRTKNEERLRTCPK